MKNTKILLLYSKSVVIIAVIVTIVVIITIVIIITIVVVVTIVVIVVVINTVKIFTFRFKFNENSLNNKLPLIVFTCFLTSFTLIFASVSQIN